MSCNEEGINKGKYIFTRSVIQCSYALFLVLFISSCEFSLPPGV